VRVTLVVENDMSVANKKPKTHIFVIFKM